MAKHIVLTAVLWVVLTAIGEVLVWTPMFPTPGSTEARDFDQIFRTLLIMGIPVFTVVVAILAYAMLAFRAKGDPALAAAPLRGRGGIVPRVWIAVTSLLAVAVIIHPGLTGLAKLQSDKNGFGWGSTESDLLIRVTAFQWNWRFEYPESGVTVAGAGRTLLLPDDSRVRFEVQSTDVIHSLWIPAFRMKIDAIPGRTTFFTVDIDREGAFQGDSAYRIQCAELCGLSHDAMSFPIEVVSPEEFKTWLDAQASAVGRR